MESKSSSNRKTRRVRRKVDEVKGLSITSLLDVLTIILVFLIKNVSTESVKISTEKDINYPSTITNDLLMDKAEATPVKIFTDRIILGNESLNFGSPQDLLLSTDKRKAIQQYLQAEAGAIYANNPEDVEACLIVQADSAIQCEYISEIVKIGTSVGYTRIYFATLEDPDWLKNVSVASR
ncbi:MAG: biopolymer transporter ExbD [Candidatus Cloacimonetes bacterium]|nr:biopolymer transporter ExbD [Candidatus Cloacimonadota bacterium]